MKKIFISHRSCDAKYANALVQYLENIGIKKNEIMYTSADSSGIQYDLGKEVNEALNQAEKFIIVLSPNYYESIYCCNEMGYIWGTGKVPIIFGLSGIDTEKDYKGFVNSGWMIRRLNNPRHIDFLYQELQPYSSKEFISPVQPNEYKDAFIENINKTIELDSLNKVIKEKEKYSPEKIIDIDTLIQNNYYMDKELLFFKYIRDKNNYVWGLTENIKSDIEKWEKKNKLKNFLSNNLENFLVMLTNKRYLSSKIVTKKEYAIQDYVGKNDGYSKTMRAVFNADENGCTEHNYFTMDERLFRAITNINELSQKKINNTTLKYKTNWWQRLMNKKDD